MLKRYHIICSGRVQGVGFRFFCKLNATSIGVTGYAKNLEDGTVELEVQGRDIILKRFIEKVKKGNSFISVKNANIQEITSVPNERGFRTI